MELARQRCKVHKETYERRVTPVERANSEVVCNWCGWMSESGGVYVISLTNRALWRKKERGMEIETKEEMTFCERV